MPVSLSGGSASWGTINKAGEVVVPFQFDALDDFSEGLAKYRIGEPEGYISPAGSRFIQLNQNWLGGTTPAS